jgi:hypothetical protein
MAKLHELQADLSQAKAYWNKNRSKKTPNAMLETKLKIRQLTADIQAILTKGAQLCPECEQQPLGMQQPQYFQVSCTTLHKPMRQSKGRTVEEAVDNWNAEAYFVKPGTEPIKIGAVA